MPRPTSVTICLLVVLVELFESGEAVITPGRNQARFPASRFPPSSLRKPASAPLQTTPQPSPEPRKAPLSTWPSVPRPNPAPRMTTPSTPSFRRFNPPPPPPQSKPPVPQSKPPTPDRESDSSSQMNFDFGRIPPDVMNAIGPSIYRAAGPQPKIHGEFYVQGPDGQLYKIGPNGEFPSNMPIPRAPSGFVPSREDMPINEYIDREKEIEDKNDPENTTMNTDGEVIEQALPRGGGNITIKISGNNITVKQMKKLSASLKTAIDFVFTQTQFRSALIARYI